MSISFLAAFRVDGITYTHVIHTETDTTSITSENGKVVFTVDSHGYLSIPGHGRVGKFNLSNKMEWSFENITDKPFPEIVDLTPTQNLLSAERELAKRYLENKNAYTEQA